MNQQRDPDPQQTREWLESLEAVVALDGTERARSLMSQVLDEARRRGVLGELPVVTDYVNTLPASTDDAFPGDERIEQRIEDIVRWNAAVMVAKANKLYAGLGGHISTFASAATLYEVGMNHFFRGKQLDSSGDQIYYQGHSAPGLYSRTFLEGRFTEENLNHFRRESDRNAGVGLSSYPHPRLMEDYWEFPTVSMGLGPMAAIYQARCNRYMAARDLGSTAQSRVWAFLGDGETDEPEAAGALTLAARERLDNLTFVINCNLQRLDGPVRGNGKIIQELEGLYRGAGWNVIKVVWSREWDPVLAADEHGVLRGILNEILDGQWQHFAEGTGVLLKERLFNQDPAVAALVEHLSDAELAAFRPGGHDRRKVWAAYQAAVECEGKPTLILSHTVKGFRTGPSFAGKNSAHQMKKMEQDQLTELRDTLEIPFTDDELRAYPFYHPGESSEEVQYLKERRAALGGPLPSRRTQAPKAVELPGPKLYATFEKGVEVEGGVSTTMVFAQLMSHLLKHKSFGPYVVPIIPDEARTFGMDPLFRQVGIYSSKGQLYEPVDKKVLLFYKEAKDGQLLEEGITEAGAMSSFMAAGTAHATHGVPLIPFYTFYSMFGFQRIGDQAWAFGDARGRGFLMGATSGRTTLNGEGLQHEDGQSHILACTFPNVLAYDPAFSFELATLVEEGLRRMVGENEDIYYYITIHNENYAMPPMPDGIQEGIIEGLYPFRSAAKSEPLTAQLFGSGPIMKQVLRAQEILADRYGVAADVWSATSYQQLRNDALCCERENRLHPGTEPRVPAVSRILDGVRGPFIAATDHMKLLPELVARWIPGTFVPLGTDGYGMSDTREALRRHFEVDAESIVIATLDGLRQDGLIGVQEVARAIEDLGVDPAKVDPLTLTDPRPGTRAKRGHRQKARSAEMT